MNSILQSLSSTFSCLSETLFLCHNEQQEKDICGHSYVIGAAFIVALTGIYAIRQLAFTSQQILQQDNFFVRLDDKRGWLRRFQDLSSATIKDIKSRWQRQYNPLKVKQCDLFPALNLETKAYEVDERQWINSTKLIVLIHGLNSSPLAWSKYLEEISKLDNVSYFAPYVYKKGYCKCKEAARPILEVIQKYEKKCPGNPIYLAGHSYGAIVAADIELKLKARNIRLISIAGPYGGSKLINWISLLHLGRCFGISSKKARELAYQGPWITKKLTKWRSHDQQGDAHSKTIERVFFGSSADLRVFPTESNFPNLSHSSHHLTHGESHVTIIDAVREQVLSYMLS